MSKTIDHEQQYSEEDRAYLLSRGKGYLIEQNERIFGKPGEKAPEEPGADPDAVNAKAAIAAQREADAAQAKTVVGEPSRLSGPAVDASGDQLDAADGTDQDDDELDEDITDYAESLTVKELKEKLDADEVEYDKNDLKDDLVLLYAMTLQDRRDAGEDLDLPTE